MNKYIIKTIHNDEFILYIDETFGEFINGIEKPSNSNQVPIVSCENDSYVNMRHIVSVERDRFYMDEEESEEIQQKIRHLIESLK